MDVLSGQWEHTQQVVPPALWARLDDVRRELPLGLHGKQAQLLLGAHAFAGRGQPMAEHVGHDAELVLLADGAVGGRLGADVARRTDQFGMGIAHLGTTDPTQTDLVDEHPAGQPVIDDAATLLSPAQRSDRETHHFRVPIRQTGAVTTPAISFGRDIPDESELRLCGDIGDGKRALELGVGRSQNSIAFALAGAKAIAVDPEPAEIEALRSAATAAEVTVECHVTDLADLGFATSGSIELAVADHTIGDDVDDFGRLLRQVHRVLRSSRPFVISVPHPFAGVHSTDEYGSKVLPYGTVGRTIGDWHIQLARANFRVDRILELGVSEISPVPTTLVIRAQKEGD